MVVLLGGLGALDPRRDGADPRFLSGLGGGGLGRVGVATRYHGQGLELAGARDPKAVPLQGGIASREGGAGGAKKCAPSLTAGSNSEKRKKADLLRVPLNARKE